MLSRQHFSLALAQFLGTLACALVLIWTLGLNVRSVLLANLAAGVICLAITGAAGAWGIVAANRRLPRAWPIAGILLVPVAFSGWAVDQAEPLRSSPDILLVLQCSLPLTALLVLQNAVARPLLAPPASEAPLAAGVLGRRFTHLFLILMGVILAVSFAARFAVAADSTLAAGGIALILPLLAIAFAIGAAHSVLAPALNLSERPALLAQMGGAAAVANLALNLILVPRFGVAGAATSVLLTYAALGGVALAAAHRRFPISWEYPRLAKIACAALIVYGAILRWPRTDEWLVVSAYGAITMVGFAVVLGLSGFLAPRERDALREARQRSRAWLSGSRSKPLRLGAAA